MFSTLDNANKNTQQVSWEQRLLKNAGRGKTSLKPEYQELKFTLHRKLVDKINLEALATIDNQRVRSEVRQAVISLIDAEPTLLSSLEKQQISDEVLDEVFGLGPLEPLLQDPTVSDILVNGFDNIYVERAGRLVETNVRFKDQAHLRMIIDRIVSNIGRRIDDSSPIVDARLGDGSRVCAVIPPLSLIGPALTIEDTAELKLQQGHVVRLETRPLNIEGAGAINQRDLVINALRMRPDRIIVGECRGPEAFDMMQAMNTGHDGSMTTTHANSPRDAFSRLETMVMMASAHVPDTVIRQMLASAIQLVIHCARLTDGSRKLTGISEVLGVEDGHVQMQDIFVLERTGVGPRGRVLGKFAATGVRPQFMDRLKAYGLHLPDS